MALSLQLLISLDSLADSFVESLRTSVAVREQNVRSDLIRCWFTSKQWVDSESPDTEVSFGKLSDAIFLELNNRQLDSVDICLALYAKSSQSIETFLPLYRYFERFLRVVAIRRLYVIYPRRATELTYFRENFTKLLRETSTAACNLREIHLLIAPEDIEAKSIQWPQSAIESYYMVNLTGQCRARLDELLTTCTHPCCNSSYGRLIFDQEAWRTYWTLRAKFDLTRSSLIDADSTLDMQAKKFVEANDMVESNYTVGFPSLSMGSLDVKSKLEMDRSHHPTQRLLEEFLIRQNEVFEQTKENEDAHFETLEQAYRTSLVQVMDGDKDSLDGFRRALYLHRSILSIADDPEKHQPLIVKRVVSKELVPVVNQIVRCVNTLLGLQKLSELKASAADTTIALKLEQIQNAMGQAKWSNGKLGIRTAFSRVIQTLKIMQHTSMPNEIINNDLEKAIKTSFTTLDDELERLQKQLIEKRQSLENLKTEFTPFQKVKKAFSYRKRNQAILNEIRKINQQYQQWGISANIYMDTISRFLALYGYLKLISELVGETRERIKKTARVLSKFDNVLTNKHEELRLELSRIPEGPIRNGVVLSYLSKTNMEALYRKFGPAEIGDYINFLLLESDKVPETWGQWALVRLDKYLDRLNSYCQSLFDSIPSLDLPSLMFRHFDKDLLVHRMKHLIRLTSNTMLPLCERNLTDRRYQMLFSFPDDVTGQLKKIEPEIVYENPRVALERSQVVYVHNTDRTRLDLNLSLCNFPPEDYLYWDIFENAQEEI